MCYNNPMDWTFDLGWFIGGLVILIAGGLLVVFHRQIGDNLASGVRSYDRIKLVGVITIIVGFLVTANLHTLILGAILGLFFH